VIDVGLQIAFFLRSITYIVEIVMPCIYQSDHLSGKAGNVGQFDSCQKMSGILLKVRKMSGKKFVTAKLSKIVYCKLHIFVHTGI